MEAVYAPNSLSWAQIEPGRFEKRSEILEAHPLEISWRRFNVGFKAEATLNAGKTVIGVLADPRTSAKWFGATVDNGTIAASTTCIDVRTEGRAAFYQVGVDIAALAQNFSDTPDALALVQSVAGVSLAQDHAHATLLRACMHRLFSGGLLKRSSSPKERASSIMRGTLVPLLATTLDSVNQRPTDHPKSLCRRLAAVRRCETYMRAHIDSTITLMDLSTISGMRSRSLINAFQAVTGLTPMDYLKRIRLNGVHRALRVADKAETRIIDVATAWGFWHMGHFAADYRAMFGESPSRTLLN